MPPGRTTVVTVNLGNGMAPVEHRTQTEAPSPPALVYGPGYKPNTMIVVLKKPMPPGGVSVVEPVESAPPTKRQADSEVSEVLHAGVSSRVHNLYSLYTLLDKSTTS